MGAIGNHFQCAPLFKGVGGGTQRARRVDHIIHQNRCSTLYIANQVHDLGFVSAWAAFVDNGQVRVVQLLSNGSSPYYAADIGRYHNQIFVGAAHNVGVKNGRCVYIVDRYGDFVLLSPPLKLSTMVLWAAPTIFLSIGVFGLFRWFRRRPEENWENQTPLTVEENKKLADALNSESF